MKATNTLHRRKDRGWVGGICAGLAEYFAVSPTWLRLIFVLWSLSSRFAVIWYVLLWLLLPDAASAGMSWVRSVRHNMGDLFSVVRRWSQDLGAIWDRAHAVGPSQARHVMALGGVLAFTGLLFLADSLSLFGPLHLHHLQPLALILMGAVLLNRARRI